MTSFRASGELASRFGGYLPTSTKGKTYVYVEVRPELLQDGGFKNPEDRAFLQEQCTNILLADGLVTRQPDGSIVDTQVPPQPWKFPSHRGDSAVNGPGWEAYLKFCRKGLTGPPGTDVFDIADLRPEALHCIIKTTALLADLGDTLALLTPVPFDLSEQLRLRWGWYKPQSGYEASTAAQWARNVSEWGPLLATHPDADAYISAVQAMSKMIAEAMHRDPNVARFNAAAKEYHRIMLTTFPKVTLRIYEHALLVHVPEVLSQGSLLDGSSWFLEAYNKVWKNQLLRHSNGGGGKAKDSQVAPHEKRSEAGLARLRAEQRSRQDKQALRAVWACSHP
jgi:hypothetical protein